MSAAKDIRVESFLSGLATEFQRLRRMSFVAGFFFLPATERVRRSGYWSNTVFPSFVMTWDSSSGEKPWWLDTIAGLQKRLRKAELRQLEAVSAASITGLACAFAAFVALAATFVWYVGHNSDGHGVWIVVTAYVLWFALRHWVGIRLSRGIDGVEGRIKAMLADLAMPVGGRNRQD